MKRQQDKIKTFTKLIIYGTGDLSSQKFIDSHEEEMEETLTWSRNGAWRT